MASSSTRKNQPTLRSFLLTLILALLTACTPTVSSPVSPASAASKTPAPTVAPAAAPTATMLPSPTSPPPALWLSTDLPEALSASLQLPSELTLAKTEDAASLRLEVGTQHVLSTWTYALAAAFPTYTDDISAQVLSDLWINGTPAGEEGRELLVAPSTLAVFTSLWGKPSSVVRSVPITGLVDAAWKDRAAWVILPFESLEPRLKVIAIDGQSPVRKDFDPTRYPLLAQFSLAGDETQASEIAAAYGPGSAAPLVSASNRDPKKLTTVVLTGVTALVRGTAALMEYHGMDYPAKDIGDLLRQADILHINNEVPFAKNCPPPYPWSGLVFCSQARYIELMDSIGTDVVDLSGDHFADWGADAMRFTLDLYRQRKWPIYGGGENIDEAKKPALFEHNGNKIAFLGCNYKQKGYATASATNPGAVHCDPAWLDPEIAAVKADGYLPIVTYQDAEYYEYIARPALVEHFRNAADSGAVIVSGSQAHQPHAFEFYAGSFLHYGLGNLFFDQIGMLEATSWAFIDRHVVYNGKYISTEMISIVFVDLARPRFATPEERREMLFKVFQAGGN